MAKAENREPEVTKKREQLKARVTQQATVERTNITDKSCTGAKEKKKRTANPGVRVQGGRIYDSELGTTCHQCRQKTVEVKAKCTQCTLHWCSRCLLNRYGEVVEKVTKIRKWPCPRCRELCNCSNCRKATGILANVCKAAGMSSVSELLQKNPAAKRPALATATEPKPKIARAAGKSRAKQTQLEADEVELLRDEELGARPVDFPQGEDLQIFKGPRRHTRGAVWPPGTSSPMAIPSSCNPGDLAEILEFLKVFGASSNCEISDLALLAVELIQPQGSKNAVLEDQHSLVGKVHQKLLDLVRKDWGMRGMVGTSGWQQVMQHYLKQERIQAARKLGANLEQLSPSAACAQSSLIQEVKPLATSSTDAASPTNHLLCYPGESYWMLDAGSRVRMLRELCHDALGTAALRERMERVLEHSSAASKEQRQEAAAARKEAKQALQQEQHRQIAVLLAGGGAEGMTLEQQRALLDAARAKAQAETVGDLQAVSSALMHPVLRTLPLGSDRDNRLFWKLQTAGIFTGKEGSVLVAKPWRAVDADNWSCHLDLQRLADSLDPRGRCEGRLKQQLCTTFGIAAERDCADFEQSMRKDEVAGSGATSPSEEDPQDAQENREPAKEAAKRGKTKRLKQ